MVEEEEEVDRGALERLVVDLGVVVVVDFDGVDVVDFNGVVFVVVFERMFFFLLSTEEELEDDVEDVFRLLEAVSLLRVICGFRRSLFLL